MHLNIQLPSVVADSAGVLESTVVAVPGSSVVDASTLTYKAAIRRPFGVMKKVFVVLNTYSKFNY